MDNLLLFTSGKGVYRGRSFLKDRMDEINSLHLKAHRFQNEAKQKGLLDKQLLRGGLSHKNLIESLLEWPMT
jgi:hypothetical protein